VRFTTRVSLFFLAVLAVVLIGFSITIWFLVDRHLRSELNEQLKAGMQTLRTAAESPDITFFTGQTTNGLSIEVETSSDRIRWLVLDQEGLFLGQSANLAEPSASTLRDALTRRLPDASSAARQDTWFCPVNGEVWQIRTLRFMGKRIRDFQGRIEDREITCAVAMSMEPSRQTLRELAFWLIIVALVIWGLIALISRRIFRRALRPLYDVVTAARDMPTQDLSSRLPVSDDRDEIEMLTTTFNELLGRFERLFQQQRNFTGEASHQLRTPLTALLGQVDVALRRERSPEEYRRTLREVRAQGASLFQIVETLLFMARLEAGPIFLNAERLDWAAWMNTYARHWLSTPRQDGRQLDVDFRLLETPCFRPSLPGLNDQILDNLLDNACKYSPPKSRIQCSLVLKDDELVLTVADQGIGISPHDQERIFTPFFRSDKVRRMKSGGVGLGLAVVKRMVDLLSGTIELKSTLGVGTEFVLRFPLRLDFADDTLDPLATPLPWHTTRTTT
jgi:signal transduction histidine kinase